MKNSKVTFYLRQRINASVLLYKVYYYLIRRHKGSRVLLPDKFDSIYVDGFPRSGNTFLVSMIKNCYENELTFNSHHLHTIAGIKIALNKKIKTFILIRKPIDAISSFLVLQVYYNNDRRPNQEYVNTLIRSYISYYKFVIANKKHIYLLAFDDVISATLSELFRIGKICNINIAENVIEDRYKSAYNLYILGQNTKPKERSNMPNKEKELLKSELSSFILQSHHYNEAQFLYSNLTEQP